MGARNAKLLFNKVYKYTLSKEITEHIQSFNIHKTYKNKAQTTKSSTIRIMQQEGIGAFRISSQKWSIKSGEGLDRKTGIECFCLVSQETSEIPLPARQSL